MLPELELTVPEKAIGLLPIVLPILGTILLIVMRIQAGRPIGFIYSDALVMLALILTTISNYTGNWAGPLIAQPAIVTVPAAFLTVIVVSKATQRTLPPDVNRIRLRMHAPDRLGFIRDRDIARFGTAEERARLANGRHRQ